MVSRKTKPRTYEVLISFSGLNVGDMFVQEADDIGWAEQHVALGYLRDISADHEEEQRRGSEERQG